MSDSSKHSLFEVVAHIRAQQKTAVILARHGQTASNREKRFVGCQDIPLDDVGHQQAALLARRFAPIAFDHIYASSLSRAIETARAIREPEIIVGLEELNQGVLEGQPSNVLADEYPDLLTAWQADPGSTRIPGGESLGDVQERAMEAISHILAQPPTPQTVAIFTHQMTLASILCAITERPLKAYQSLCHRNAAFSVLTWHEGSWELLWTDDQAHISDAD